MFKFIIVIELEDGIRQFCFVRKDVSNDFNIIAMNIFQLEDITCVCMGVSVCVCVSIDVHLRVRP